MNTDKSGKYGLIVIGVSAGGFNTIPKLIRPLPEYFPIPVIIVQHVHEENDNTFYIQQCNRRCKLKVKEAEQLEKALPGYVYIAPAGYHLYIDGSSLFSLSVDDKVNYSRPSIDVLFESAASAHRSGLIGIILTGANIDGTMGMIAIKENGGMTIAQDPDDAEAAEMPRNAINSGVIDHILPSDDIGSLIIEKTIEK